MPAIAPIPPQILKRILELDGWNVVTEDPEEGEEREDMVGAAVDPITKNEATGNQAASVPSGVFSLSVPFAKGTISVQVRVTGDAMRPSHLARVRKYLELAEEDWSADGDEMGIPRAE